MPNSEQTKRPYNVEDVRGLSKHALYELIEQQIDCWPKPRLIYNTTTAETMRQEILNPANGFHKFVDISDSARSACPSSPPPMRDDSPPNHDAPCHDQRSRSLSVARSTADASQAPSGASQAPSGNVHTTTIHLFMDDRRAIHNVQKIAVDVAVPSHSICQDDAGTMSVLAAEVIGSLQSSPNSLEGPVKLGYPHPLRPEYTQYFAKCEEHLSEGVKFQPDRLPLSSTSSISIYVDNPETVKRSLQPTRMQTAVASVCQVNTNSSSLPLPDPVDKKQAKITWLKEQMSSRPGYDLFGHCRHRILQNPEVVETWRFAVDFYDYYSHSKSPFGRVNKSDIQTALGVGETWLNEALEGYKVVKIHGPQGTAPSPEVTDMIGRTTNGQGRPEGRSALLHFLKAWSAQHADG
ncbi:hypothetical protein CVT26_002484 [Gymnopilus dilepis]|uniref:Uncharacterized protein n=1 Tax=Gymnopilus dilepis TaxID=231916 RepID=A0A409Y3V5_9AGAR|nr:hypothetical protein CVT26_002484 [Gymnopilus dilepis]